MFLLPMLLLGCPSPKGDASDLEARIASLEDAGDSTADLAARVEALETANAQLEAQLAECATQQDIADYATEQGYVTPDDLSDYATQTWVEDQRYVTTDTADASYAPLSVTDEADPTSLAGRLFAVETAVASLASEVATITADYTTSGATLTALASQLATIAGDYATDEEAAALADAAETNSATYTDEAVADLSEVVDGILDSTDDLFDYVEVDTTANTVKFVGANVYVQSGSGATDAAVNGLGNLIVGYNEDTLSRVRDGSHNLIVGKEHEWRSYGGLAAGTRDEISGPWASALGYLNTATGSASVAAGGGGNQALSDFSAVFGGSGNEASGPYSVIAGGQNNTVESEGSLAAGGSGNSARVEANSSVFGGYHGDASASLSTVIGGYGNTTSAGADYSAIIGGYANIVTADYASIIGGEHNSADLDYGVESDQLLQVGDVEIVNQKDRDSATYLEITNSVADPYQWEEIPNLSYASTGCRYLYLGFEGSSSSGEDIIGRVVAPEGAPAAPEADARGDAWFATAPADYAAQDARWISTENAAGVWAALYAYPASGTYYARFYVLGCIR